MLKRFYRFTQSINDGFALIGNTLALQGFALGFGLGLLDLEDLFGLAARLGGHLLALRGVDIVHGRFDLGIRVHIGHQGFNDSVAKIIHHGREFTLDGVGDIVFFLEYIIQVHFGNVGAHGIKDVRCNLVAGRLQLVIGRINLALYHLVLHRDHDFNENVIHGLGFHFDLELLDAQVNLAGNLFKPGNLEIQPRTGHAHEAAEALNHGRLGGIHGVKTAENGSDAEKN